MSHDDEEQTIALSEADSVHDVAGPFFLVLNGAHTGQELPIPLGTSTIGREGAPISLGFADGAISRAHAEVIRDMEKVVISDLGSTNGLFVNDKKIESQRLEHGNLLLVGRTYLKFVDRRDLEIQRLRVVLRMATTDSLTGVTNKRAFLERLSAEFQRAKRTNTPLSLIIFDLDHFKKFNDRYGHLAGDEILMTLAGKIPEILRHQDLLSRFGGEEFIVLLPGLKENEVRTVAESIRKLIESTSVAYEGQELSITVSLGCATYLPDNPASMTHDILLRTADERLYEAKAAGRNCYR